MTISGPTEVVPRVTSYENLHECKAENPGTQVIGLQIDVINITSKCAALCCSGTVV